MRVDHPLTRRLQHRARGRTGGGAHGRRDDCRWPPDPTEPKSRLKIGWPGVAGLATYLLFIAPELFSGHWTWSGYNFVNDSATQMVLVNHLKVHGTKPVGLLPPRSTSTEYVRVFLATSYPLGTTAQLATLSGLLHTGAAVLYEGYIAALAGMTAMSLTALSEGFLGPRKAALAAFIGVSAALNINTRSRAGSRSWARSRRS